MLSPHETRWDPLVYAAASSEGVEPALVKAVIWNETRFTWVGDPHPVTGRRIEHPAQLDREEPRISDASVGVMQILTGTAGWIYGRPVSREELRDPSFNIYLGTRVLSMYLHGWRPGADGARIEGARQPFDVAETLAAYNGGPGAVQNRRADGTFPNQGYVTAGLAAYDYFRSLELGPPEPLGPPSPEGAPPPEGPGIEPGTLGPAIGVGAIILVGALLALLGGRR